MSELHEQIAVIEYLELLKRQGHVILFSALPNNTFTKSWAQKRKQTAEGVRKGVPDIMVIVEDIQSTRHLVFIEMKRTKGGTVSAEQKEWIAELSTIPFVTAVVCKGFEQAKKVIDTIIMGKEQTARNRVD